jgi:hypothetical protein
MTEENKRESRSQLAASPGSAPKGVATPSVESGIPGVGGVCDATWKSSALERQARVDALEQEVKELQSQLQSRVRIALKAGRGIGRAAAQMEEINKEEWSKIFRDQLDEFCKENSQLRKFIQKWASAFSRGDYMEPVYKEWERLKDAGLLDDETLEVGGVGAEHLETSPAEKEQNVPLSARPLVGRCAPVGGSLSVEAGGGTTKP